MATKPSSEVVIRIVPERLGPSQLSAFRNELRELTRTDQPKIVLDMSSVRHFDSASIEMLLHTLSAVVRADGELKLASLSPEAAIILSMTRVDRFFEVFQTVDEAVRSFEGFAPDTQFNQPWNSVSLSGDDPKPAGLSQN